jgi:hypothetical protein
MWKTARLLFLLLLAGSGLLIFRCASAQDADGFPAFWKEFKTAVARGNMKRISSLTKFPLAVSNGVPEVGNREEMRQRIDEVFKRDTDATQCFATRKPSADTENKNRYTISCPSKPDEFVVYEFERTESGWRFIHRQFPTKCGCR